jgi:hypothetical protein
VNGRRAVGGLLLLAWLGLAPSPEARAQSGPGAEASKGASAETEQARQLYKDGVKEAARGKWDKARDLFVEAFRLKRHFQIAFSLGQAELKVGQHLSAAEHLAFFLKEAQSVPEEDRRKAGEMLDEARRHVGTLHIQVDRAGAEILVDGASMGRAPLDGEVFVAPGQRVIEARLDGFRAAREERTVAAGAPVRLSLKLGTVDVERSPPPAAPTAPVERRSGAPEGGPNMGILIGGAAASVVGIGLGAGFAIGSNAKAACRDDTTADLITVRQPCENARADFANVSLASFVAGGVLALGTAGYYLLTRRSSRKAAVPVAAFVGPSGGGVLMTTRW